MGAIRTVCMCVCTCMYVCVCVCVCVWYDLRKAGAVVGAIRTCVYVCVCVCVWDTLSGEQEQWWEHKNMCVCVCVRVRYTLRKAGAVGEPQEHACVFHTRPHYMWMCVRYTDASDDIQQPWGWWHFPLWVGYQLPSLSFVLVPQRDWFEQPCSLWSPSGCKSIYCIHLSKENYQVLIYCEPRQAHKIPSPEGALGTETSPWQGRYPSFRALSFQTHLWAGRTGWWAA